MQALEQIADSLESLQRTLQIGEKEARITTNNNITDLVERLGMLTSQMTAEHDLMAKLAESRQN